MKLPPMNIERVDAASVVDFMKENHYLGTVPNTSRFCFAGYENGKLKAVAVYGPCQAAKLPRDYLELKRLAACGLDATLSSFLAHTLRLLKDYGVRAVLTWADQDQGHHGGIYQATNWIYAEPRSYAWVHHYRAPDGTVIDHKKAFAKFGTCSKKKLAEIAPYLEPFLPAMKLRYLMPLNATESDCLRELRAIKKPYPKPYSGVVLRPAHSQRFAA